ncbi:MAG: MarR family transcriptional regulator [Candidatus Promineifilaceae bacterium]
MDERVGYLLKRAQQALRLEMDSGLQNLNLTTAQYAALNALEQNPKSSNAALARACFVTPQTMIEIIKNLETAGFVSRQSHPKHGRIIQTVLTENGRAKLATAHQVIGGIEEKMLADLSPIERTALAAYLQQCFSNLVER